MSNMNNECKDEIRDAFPGVTSQSLFSEHTGDSQSATIDDLLTIVDSWKSREKLDEPCFIVSPHVYKMFKTIVPESPRPQEESSFRFFMDYQLKAVYSKLGIPKCVPPPTSYVTPRKPVVSVLPALIATVAVLTAMVIFLLF